MTTIRRLCALLFWALLARGAVAADPEPPMTRPPASVGFQHFTIPDAAQPDGPPIEVGLWYPTSAVPSPHPLQLSTQTVAPDGPVSGHSLPLVVMSHGAGGFYAGHFDTALALAKAGFVVAALTHTGDNYRDQSRATDLPNRPRQLKVLTDYMLADWPDHARIDPQRVGAFGFSAGGFTVLAAAGGEADLSRFGPHCAAHPHFFDCGLLAAHPVSATAAPPVWTHDARLKAVVAAAPAAGFTFGKAGLSRVTAKVDLWRAADDHILPSPLYVEAVRDDLPRAPDYHVVPAAGHFDFLAPCSPALAHQFPAICTSAPGFDRSAFHEAFNMSVVKFFTAALAD